MKMTLHEEDEDEARYQEELSSDKQILFDKLAKIFDPITALDFVSPKTYETRHHATIEELSEQNYDQPKERLERLRSMDHYQTTTQSLSRADLEASYQAFVRDQVGRNFHRDDLEQYVRNSSDIDAAKRYLDSAVDVRVQPTQSHLLFHSSKLNEEKAHLMRQGQSQKTLKQLNDDTSLAKYFLQPLTSESVKLVPVRSPEEIDKSIEQLPPRLAQGDKKYRITFVKSSSALKNLANQVSHRMAANDRVRRQVKERNLESLLSAETSTSVHERSSANQTTNIHRETFPPLSLSALKEYRPTIAASPLSASMKIHSASTSRKVLYKTDFIWEQSIVSPRDQ